ncbi:single-stranded-DNA-specific exonuclease RecJ [Candidatus Gracilibacteria bacterium]|nr:single-stranded-DNA-specific exonuclease RecJ [Candidatus Gracilibacteria bacterium]
MGEDIQTIKGKRLQLLHKTHPENLTELLLALRNVDRDFLTKEILHDPLLLPDIQKTIERIGFARESKERVMIFGDYDVDGISSTAALFLFLRDELGIDVSYRLPHRVHDGYGIKSYHMDEIAQTGTKLVITVDCGTKDREPIEHAQTLGMDVIVTDHHSCPDILPDCVAVVNPRRTDSLYPFSALSGSGVVWKVIHALSDFFFPEKTEGILQKYVDIVSLGTVADCMPMQDENRTIVRRGILQSQQSHHPFFQTFSGALNRPILTEEDIGFFVGPLLNAGGRITTPHQSLATLLSSSLDSYARIQELIAVNEIRKGKSRDAFEKALESIDSSAPILIYIDADLEHGILGLVAAKITELYHKPSAIFTLHDGFFIGSLRAPPGIDLVRILDESRDYLARFGGHAGAAGCSIAESDIDDAVVSLINSADKFYSGHDSTPLISVDTVLDASAIDLNTLRGIEILRPFGIGFPAPLFLLEHIQLPVLPLGQSGEHIRWDYPGKLDILGFRFGDYQEKIAGKTVSLIGTLKAHTWRDTVTPQFLVVDVVLED